MQKDRLRQKVMRSIMGESDLDTELLKEMLEKNEADLTACEARLSELEDEKGAEESRMRYLPTIENPREQSPGFFFAVLFPLY